MGPLSSIFALSLRRGPVCFFEHSAICFFIFHSLITEIFEKVAEIKKPKKLAFSIQKKLTARTTWLQHVK